jgi:ribosome maturation factor RimP
MDLETTIRSVVEDHGLELVEVWLGHEQGSRILRVTIEREGGLDLDTIAQTSERISRRLDLEGFEAGPYRLEVSSPGLERPLKAPADFIRRVGHRVKVRVAAPGSSAQMFEGTIARAGEEDVTVATEAGERTVAYGDIVKARTVFEWGDTKKASSAEKV